MSLDINTHRGQESVQEENQMLEILRSSYKCQFIHTPITKAGLIDGFIIRNNELRGIYESKCRRDSLQTFRNKYNNEWLVSFHKLQAGSQIAKALATPFWGFLYLVPDNQVLAIKLTDDKGNFIPEIRIERRQTSKCCNGGTMIDTCGLINLSNAIFVKSSNQLVQ